MSRRTIAAQAFLLALYQLVHGRNVSAEMSEMRLVSAVAIHGAGGLPS